MFNLKPWPEPDLCQTYTLHIDSSYMTFVQSYLKIQLGIQNI